MIKHIVNIILVSFCCCGFYIPQNNCPLKYDGFYFTEADEGYNAYIKFYADGSVIHTTSSDKVDEVAKFFTKENSKRVLSGTYAFGKCNINFVVIGKTGKMKFSGNVEGENLFLKAVNSNDGTSSKLTFTYYEPPLPGVLKQ